MPNRRPVCPRARVAWCRSVLPMLALAAAATPARAADPAFTAGAITVEQPWSRATPGGAAVAAGYLTIRNAGDAPDRLVSAVTEVAGHTGPHSMATVGGVMQMRPLPQGIAVPPHGTAVLSPGGDHLMLEGLRHPLRAGALPVTFAVEGMGARGPGAAAGQPMKMR